MNIIISHTVFFFKFVGFSRSSLRVLLLCRLKEDRLNEISETVLTRQEVPEDDSEVLFWVSRSRKLEEKRNAEKEKATALSRMLDEQVTLVNS